MMIVYRMEVALTNQQNNVVSWHKLTPRQRQVLELAATGATDDEIALQLEIEFPTVRKHLQLAYNRLGAKNKAHAVAMLVARDLCRGAIFNV